MGPTPIALLALEGRAIHRLRPLVVAYGHEVPEDESAKDPDALVAWMEALPGFGGLVLVGFERGAPIGFLTVALFQDPTTGATIGLIGHLYVLPKYRSVDLRDRTREMVMGWAKGKGLSHVGGLLHRPAVARLFRTQFGGKIVGTYQGALFAAAPVR